jgi:hypothetical protein
MARHGLRREGRSDDVEEVCVTQLPRYVVQVRLNGSFSGSGFFVAPGFVLTCAHVVLDRGAEVTVLWGERELSVSAITLHPPGGADDYHPFPDLALLQVAVRDHPCVRFARTEPSPNTVVTAAGFSTATPTSGTRPDSLLLTVAGQADRFLRVVADQVVPGFSGSPAADLDTGEVLGVVKASRDIDAVQGGWLTPVPAVLDVLGPDLLAANEAHHRRNVPLPLPEQLVDVLRADHVAAELMPHRHLTDQLSVDELYVEQFFGEAPSVRPPDAFRLRTHLIIESPPGAGKSTLVRHLVRVMTSWWLDAEGDDVDPAGAPLGAVVPVAVRAADVVGGTVAEALAARPITYVNRPSPDLFTRPPLPDVRWLVFVDGLDEITEPDRRRDLIRYLAECMTRGEHRFVVVTRPLGEPDLAPLRPHTGSSFQLRPFDDAALAEFAQRWFTAHRTGDAEVFLHTASTPQLRQQLGLPLLATIAARLQSAGGQLPRSRAGLYGEFVRYLIHARSAAFHRDLLRQLGHVYVGDRSLADVLLRGRDAVLEAAATEHLAGRSMVDAAAAAVNSGDALLPPEWPDPVRTLLLGTGLVVHEGGELTFIHRSFAEYLASARIAAEVGPSREDIFPYVDDVIYPSGTSNLAKFVVERWGARPDSDVDGVLGWYILYERHPHALPAAIDLMHAGLPIPGDLEQVLVTKLSNRVWSGDAQAASLLGEIIDRPSAYQTLRSLSASDRIEPHLRVIVNDILARLAPDADGRAHGIRALRRWAGNPDMWTRYLAALALTSVDRDLAISTLHRLVDGDDAWGRAAAAEQLAQLGEFDEMTAVLRRIAYDQHATVDARSRAIAAIRALGDENEADAATQALLVSSVTAEPGWLKIARKVEDHDRRLAVYREIAQHGVRGERIEAAVELWHNGESDLARTTLTALADEPGMLDDRLLATMVSVLSEEGAADVLLIAARDQRWRRAIDAGVALVRIGRYADGIRALRAVMDHPEPAARFAAARALRANKDYQYPEKVLKRLAKGRGRLGAAVQVAAVVVLVCEWYLPKHAGMIAKLARKTPDALTAAAVILADADTDSGTYVGRYRHILSSMVDDSATTEAARLAAAAAISMLPAD